MLAVNWMLILVALGAVGFLAVLVVLIALFSQRDANRQKDNEDKPPGTGGAA